MSKKPDYHVHIVREGKDEKDSYWTKVGIAFLHKDGGGINVILDALPVDGRLTIRRPKEQKVDALK